MSIVDHSEQTCARCRCIHRTAREEDTCWNYWKLLRVMEDGVISKDITPILRFYDDNRRLFREL